jgi:hypothetical protein
MSSKSKKNPKYNEANLWQAYCRLKSQLRAISRGVLTENRSGALALAINSEGIIEETEEELGLEFKKSPDTPQILAVTQRDCLDLKETMCRALAPNFETLKRAAAAGDLALLECRLVATGETVAAIVAVSTDGEGGSFTPFAVMLCGNPYEMLEPPNPDGGFFPVGADDCQCEKFELDPCVCDDVGEPKGQCINCGFKEGDHKT